MGNYEVTSDSDGEEKQNTDKTPKSEKRKNKVGIILGIIVAIFVLGAVLGGDDEDGKKDNAVVSEQDSYSTETDNQNANSKKKTEKKSKKKKAKITKDQYIKACKNVKYKKVLRNPDKYEGKKIKASIKIINVDDGFFLKTYIGKDENGRYYGINEEREKETPRLYKGDTIMAYGSICGLTEIESYVQTGSKVLNYMQEKKKKTVVDFDLKYAKLLNK